MLNRGWEVSVFNRSGSGPVEGRVRYFRGDRNDLSALETIVDEVQPDVTVDVCCFTPQQARETASLLAGRVDRHVFVSTVDIYGYPLTRLPYREADPRTAPISRYAGNKLECERILTNAHERGELPLTIARPAYSFGPKFVLSFFSRSGGPELLSRLGCGYQVVVPGDGTGFMHVSSAYNTGLMLAEIAMSPEATGEDFTCAHETWISQDAYYGLFADALGVEARLVHVPIELLLPLEKKSIPDDLLSELTRFQIAFSVEKFRHFFPGFVWSKSLEKAAIEYVAHHRKQGTIPECAQSHEDLLVSAWADAATGFKSRFTSEP